MRKIFQGLSTSLTKPHKLIFLPEKTVLLINLNTLFQLYYVIMKMEKILLIILNIDYILVSTNISLLRSIGIIFNDEQKIICQHIK